MEGKKLGQGGLLLSYQPSLPVVSECIRLGQLFPPCVVLSLVCLCSWVMVLAYWGI